MFKTNVSGGKQSLEKCKKFYEELPLNAPPADTGIV